MKIKSTLIPVAGISISLLLAPPCLAVEKKKQAVVTDEKKPATKARSYSSRNNHAVKIYPDVVKRQMHVIAKDNDGKEIDFFVFDLEGTLIKHYRMQEGDHQKLTGLERGKYIYQVFCGDEETVSGQLDIR